MDYLPTNFFLGFGPESIISLITTVVLLVASAFMSSSEVAFFSLNATDIKNLDMKSRKDKALSKLLAKPQLLLATILTGNNFINIAIVILSTFTVSKTLNFGDHTALEFVFNTVIITFLLLLFGEILPKITATMMGIKLAKQIAPTLLVIENMLKPISLLLVKSTETIDKRLKKHQHTSISIDELETALKITSTSKDKNTTDNEILQGIVNFGNIAVNEVMTSRLDMECVDISTPFKEVLEKIKDSGYSRLPVFSGSEDNIRGILYVKDLLPHLDKENSFRWQTLVRNAYFIPETKMIDDLLKDFQKSKIHIAVVVDEFGGTCGIITMKDILEEIIGDISDEYDDEEQPLYKKTADGYVIEAKMPLNDMFKLEEIEEDDFGEIADDMETLAGLVLAIKGEIPKTNETFTYKRYTFKIEKADDRHIESVRITITNEAKDEN